jgi:STE24 endopeptidase
MNRLAKLGKFNLDGIYRFNMSKNTKKANAAFTGLGKSKRIILGDTLLESFTGDEIETVFAHEVGHYAHKHLLIGIITGTVSSYLSLFLADMIYQSVVRSYHFQGIDDLAVLPILTIALTVITVIFSPISNALSRRNERQADRYALRNSSQPSAFISAMEKLAEQNLADRTPHPLVEFLFHGHPSVEKRIKFSKAILDS